MPRRPPPSALRLVPGPTPPRNAPKHTMPSVPRPTFCPSSIVAKGPASPPRRRHKSGSSWSSTDCADVPYLPSTQSVSPAPPVKIRGPWDHSGSIRLSFDEDSLLAPLKPVVVM
ncbi:hypothetical protein VNI00_008370 [Paramarasmius palmivorus]|uniref:Uncharacterized protein n=1 Tax=Paramarasmius palmivorus TaxID=297713 RepID=A0AAW0CX66_9AGAR